MGLALRGWITGGLFIITATLAPSAMGAAPSVKDALSLQPIQQQVDYSSPEEKEVAQCTIKAEKLGDHTAWVVRDPVGQILRMFVDSNNNNVVDQWCYYQDGLEVYRDIDGDHDGKADEYRWLHTGGTRWGLDTDEDGKVDRWKVISPEEVSMEAVIAVREADPVRFQRLLLDAEELKSLGLSAEKTQEISKLLASAKADFESLLKSQKVVQPKSNWIHFAASRPGLVPAGAAGVSKDLRVYENVMAMVDTAGATDQLFIGTLVQVGDVWRLISAPHAPDSAQAEVASGFFFRGPAANRPDVAAAEGAPMGKTQELLAKLEDLDGKSGTINSVEARKTYNLERSTILEQLAQEAEPADRGQWVRQLADTISAEAQSGNFPEGVERLQVLYAKLTEEENGKELASYVKFRQMTAEYGVSLQKPDAPFLEIQTKWLEDLEKFVADYPDSPDTSEAMLQLAIAQEFAGQEVEAQKWYERIVKEFPDSAPAKKAQGAVKRLDSVGKEIRLSGASLTGSPVNLTDLRGKFVIVHYWVTNSEACIDDLKILKEMQAKFGKSFTPLGISLDADRKVVADFVKQNRLNWPHIFEPGGLDSPPALELGILTLPTMMLVDDKGKVVNRNIHSSQLEAELKRLIK